MESLSFQETIENQFDYICKLVIENERKDYYRQLSRLKKREVSFSTLEPHLIENISTTDTYPSDFHSFNLNGYLIQVENDLLSEALESLPLKKRNILLMFYFMGMSDAELESLLHLHRNTVYRHRKKALEMIKKFMEDE